MRCICVPTSETFLVTDSRQNKDIPFIYTMNPRECFWWHNCSSYFYNELGSYRKYMINNSVMVEICSKVGKAIHPMTEIRILVKVAVIQMIWIIPHSFFGNILLQDPIQDIISVVEPKQSEQWAWASFVNNPLDLPPCERDNPST
jgi:hypothetical protein